MIAWWRGRGAVGVPAGLDRDVGMGSLVRVTGTSPVPPAALVIRQVEQAPLSDRANSAARGPWPRSVTSLTRRESWSTARSGTTSTFAPVSLAKRSPFSSTPGPMSNAVVAAPGEGVVFEDSVKDQGDVQCLYGCIENARARTGQPKS